MYIAITIGTINKNHPELLPVSLLISCEIKIPVTVQIDIKQNTKLIIEIINPNFAENVRLLLLDNDSLLDILLYLSVL